MKAVVCGCDSHPVRSLALMLKSVGFDVKMLTDKAMEGLAKRGYTGGVTAELLKNMGYVDAGLPPAEASDLDDCDLYVDIKVPDADSMLKIYPRLSGRTAIFLINGGGDAYLTYGDHYPVITTNFLVRSNAFQVYMPFDNFQGLVPRAKRETFEPPMGLLHNAKNWGFGVILDRVIERTGLRIYGSYASPAGLLPNEKVGEELSKSLAFVHMKASDCPGYALYEAFATATPIVVTELFIERMHYHDLYLDGKTCLTWGKGSFKKLDEDKFQEFIDASADSMTDQITDCVERLKDPVLNRKIGLAGHELWKKKTAWTDARRRQFESFLKEKSLL